MYNYTGLIQVEEILIPPVLPHIAEQYAYSGHVINLPQYITNSLPSELGVIIVRNSDFHVRRYVVLCALKWLLANKYSIRINPEALALLPDLSGPSVLHRR